MELRFASEWTRSELVLGPLTSPRGTQEYALGITAAVARSHWHFGASLVYLATCYSDQQFADYLVATTIIGFTGRYPSVDVPADFRSFWSNMDGTSHATSDLKDPGLRSSLNSATGRVKDFHCRRARDL